MALTFTFGRTDHHEQVDNDDDDDVGIIISYAHHCINFLIRTAQQKGRIFKMHKGISLCIFRHTRIVYLLWISLR